MALRKRLIVADGQRWRHCATNCQPVFKDAKPVLHQNPGWASSSSISGLRASRLATATILVGQYVDPADARRRHPLTGIIAAPPRALRNLSAGSFCSRNPKATSSATLLWKI
jgi:hypothetical protein